MFRCRGHTDTMSGHPHVPTPLLVGLWYIALTRKKMLAQPLVRAYVGFSPYVPEGFIFQYLVCVLYLLVCGTLISNFFIF